MCKKYNIYFLDEIVGTASVKKDGLYFLISCKCAFPKEGIYKIDIFSSRPTLHLGTCIPDGDVFTLQKRISAKSIADEDLRFEINAFWDSRRENFICVSTDKPVPCISMLRTGRFIRENGESFICF